MAEVAWCALLRWLATRSRLRDGVGQAIAGAQDVAFTDTTLGAGGKSGLHRTGCQVTPGGREPTESAAESRPLIRLALPGRGRESVLALPKSRPANARCESGGCE